MKLNIFSCTLNISLSLNRGAKGNFCLDKCVFPYFFLEGGGGWGGGA